MGYRYQLTFQYLYELIEKEKNVTNPGEQEGKMAFLKINEKFDFLEGVAASYYSIGDTYKAQKKYLLALFGLWPDAQV